MARHRPYRDSARAFRYTVGMLRTLLRTVAACVAFVGLCGAMGCPATSPAKPTKPVVAAAVDFTEAGPFLRHLLKIAEANDLAAWTLQLTPQRQARGGDYARQHLSAWREGLLKAAPLIRGAKAIEVVPHSDERFVITLVRADGNRDRLIRVSRIQGALKIDEN